MISNKNFACFVDDDIATSKLTSYFGNTFRISDPFWGKSAHQLQITECE